MFRNTLIDDFNEFFATFYARNLMDDAELASLVAQAKEIVDGVSPERLREGRKVRDEVRARFEGIKQSIDALPVETLARKFSFEEA